MPYFVRVKSYAESVGVKPLILYSVGIIACSLASVRVTSSVCQPVQGSRLDVIVWWHSYSDISSITTYRVAAALDTSLYYTEIQDLPL